MFKPAERIFENQLFDKLVRLQVDPTKYLEGAISNTYPTYQLSRANYQRAAHILRITGGVWTKWQMPMLFFSFE